MCGTSSGLIIISTQILTCTHTSILLYSEDMVCLALINYCNTDQLCHTPDIPCGSSSPDMQYEGLQH